jgi:hypothetical protein
MNGVTEQRGLSARQETRNYSRNYRFQLHLTWMLLALTSIISSCHTKGQESAESKNSSAASDSLGKPKVNIEVNKHYDDKGNVVGFDSTYTSFYSNVEGDTLKMDSLFRSFDRQFDLGRTSFFGRHFDSLFFNDSLRYPDFFHDDFFLRRYELNDLYLRDMMRRMDSLKNNFYRNHSLRERNDESKDL